MLPQTPEHNGTALVREQIAGVLPHHRLKRSFGPRQLGRAVVALELRNYVFKFWYFALPELLTLRVQAQFI